MRPAPRVLILSAPYGSGHDRVAAALAQALVAEGAHAEALDHFARFVSPTFARASRALFWAIVRHAPHVWGFAYAFSDRLPTQSPGMLGMNRLGARRLGRYLAATRPDAVVHTHPTSAGAIAWLRGRAETALPQAIVLTDFVAHSQWIYPHVDRYFVPAEEIRDALAARGVPADRIVPSGVPVDPGFAVPPDRTGLRADLGLDGDHPAVLVVAGLRGRVGGILEVCELLRELPQAFRAVVVCGHNGALAATLRHRLSGDPRFRILGWVRAMHRVMGAVDLVVTKAGGVTCAEALALGRPLVFYRSIPGQETANERFIERAGAGVRAGNRPALVAHLATLLGDPARRAELAGAARRLHRPDAARSVAKELLSLAAAR